MPATPRLRIAASLVLSALALSACGGGTSKSSKTSGKPRTTHAAATLRSVAVAPAGTLPAPVMDAATAALPDGRVVRLGGRTSADSATDSILVISGAAASQSGTLPAPQHDARSSSMSSMSRSGATLAIAPCSSGVNPRLTHPGQ